MAHMNDTPYKIIIIGDSNVGKSSLLACYADNTYCNDYKATVGMDLRFKTIMYNEKKLKLQIWDTSGQERYNALRSSFYRNTKGIILVYDVTDFKTFINVQKWYHETYANIDQNLFPDIKFALVGNKVDLKNKTISTELGKQMARDLNINIFMETSSRLSKNIDNVFGLLINDLVNTKYVQNEQNGINININMNMHTYTDLNAKQTTVKNTNYCCY